MWKSKLFAATGLTWNLLFIGSPMFLVPANEANLPTADQLYSQRVRMLSEDTRVAKLRAYLLKHKSPLAAYAERFVEAADKYGLDYRLLPAIAGVESTFAKNMISGTFNAYGWNSGTYSFRSWEDSIEHINEFLAREYVGKGKDTIDKIAKKYAPPSSSWSNGVKFFMRKIEETEV